MAGMAVSGTGTSAALSAYPAGARGATGKPLSTADQEQIKSLKNRDTEVRAHEQAHRSAGGQYAGPATFTYQKGPDGTNYAIGGEVQIDTSAIAKDPAATAAKMQQVERAALAPANPSGQDLRVAQQAAQAAVEAESDQRAGGSGKAAAGAAGTPGTAGSGSGAAGQASGDRQAATAFQAQAIAAASATGQGGIGIAALAPSQISRGLAAYGAANTSQPSARFAAVA